MLRRRQNKDWSVFCMAGGIGMALFGLIEIIPKRGMFGVIWTLGAAGFAVMNAYNIFSEKGIGAFRIELEIDDSDQENKKKKILSKKL